MIQTHSTDTGQSALRENIFPTDSIRPDLSAPIKPLKPLLDFPLTSTELALLILGMMACLLAVLWVIYLKITEKKRIEHSIPVGNLFMEAEQELKDLQHSSAYLQGNYPLYQEEVCQVIRKFIKNRQGIDAIRFTSLQLIQQIQTGWPGSPLLSELSAFLRQADLIKFAKAETSASQAQTFAITAIELLKKINKLNEPIENYV